MWLSVKLKRQMSDIMSITHTHIYIHTYICIHSFTLYYGVSVEIEIHCDNEYNSAVAHASLNTTMLIFNLDVNINHFANAKCNFTVNVQRMLAKIAI